MNFLKAVTPRLLAMALVVVPVALAAVYYGAFAAPRYVSQAVIGVKDTGGGSSSASGASSLAGLLQGISSPTSVSDTLYLENYIRSMGLMQRLDEQLKLRAHYAEAGLDPFYKAWPWLSREAFLDYFRARVNIRRDDISGLLSIEVQGFTPDYAKQVAQGILQDSEQFINDYSQRIARERMAFAETEVEASRKRLETVKSELLAFQTSNKLLDPNSQALAASSLTANLQAKLAAQEAELRSSQAILQEDSYQIRTLRAQIAATQAQIDAERQRSTGPVNGAQLPALNIRFQELLARTAFAEESHKAALVAAEQARLEASRKLKTLVVIEPPTQPDEALYPERLYNLMTVLAVAAMLYAIVRLMLATIREHQD